MSNLVKAWSYSRLSTYKSCPRKFKYQCIDKLPGDTWANTRGTRVHQLAESFVQGKITGMPDDLQAFSDELTHLKKLKPLVEVDLTVTKDWKPTHSMDWDGAWCRSRADVLVPEKSIMTYIDHKTGRIYEESHEVQGKLSATCVFAHYPKVKTVNVEMWYFDQDDVRSWKYKRTDFEDLKKHWLKEIKPMMTDKKFNATPGDACKWCPYSTKKGGPCEN